MKRRLFRGFTFVLTAACVWTIFANILSDDTAVRAAAVDAARKYAGCGDKCRVTDARGERGMITLHIEFQIDKFGIIDVACRRAYLLAGDYTCAPTKR